MNIRRNSGLTFIGFLMVIAVGLFFAYAAMRVIPMYLEYHALSNAMEVLQKDPVSSKMSPSQIKTKIKMSLWASYADNNIKKEHMRISKKSEGINVQVKYEVRKPFLGNIDIIAKFDRSVILRK